jgi:hypothetical protein
MRRSRRQARTAPHAGHDVGMRRLVVQEFAQSSPLVLGTRVSGGDGSKRSFSHFLKLAAKKNNDGCWCLIQPFFLTLRPGPTSGNNSGSGRGAALFAVFRRAFSAVAEESESMNLYGSLTEESVFSLTPRPGLSITPTTEPGRRPALTRSALAWIALIFKRSFGATGFDSSERLGLSSNPRFPAPLPPPPP